MGWAGEEIICAGEIEKEEETLNFDGSLYLHAAMTSLYIPQLRRSQTWIFVTVLLHFV